MNGAAKGTAFWIGLLGLGVTACAFDVNSLSEREDTVVPENFWSPRGTGVAGVGQDLPALLDALQAGGVLVSSDPPAHSRCGMPKRMLIFRMSQGGSLDCVVMGSSF